MPELGAILKANKDNKEIMAASVEANLGGILSGNKEKAQAQVKNVATKKSNEKLFKNAVQELMLDTQISLLQIEITKQIFEGNEQVEIEFISGEMNITDEHYFSKNDFNKFLLKPQCKEFIKWLSDNSLSLTVFDAHDGVGMRSWVNLVITPKITNTKGKH